MNEEYTRVDDLWFSDGSLVIKAEKKIFRVYRAQLAARSSVFMAMIQSSTPGNQGDELMDGVPVVFMHDSADDVEAFLRAIFDSSYFMPFPEPAYIPDVLAVLRLSHKYDVGYLHRRALQHLSVGYYSASVEEYMNKPVKCHLKYRDKDQPASDEARLTRDFALITAAHEVGALWLLPMAYYIACARNFEDILTSVEKGANESLVRTCLAGCHYLSRATIRSNAFLAKSMENCLDSEQCLQLRRACLAGLVTTLGRVLDVKPFEFWADTWPDLHPITGTLRVKFCQPCYEAGQRAYKEALEDCWNHLPSYFSLPGWPELNALKEAAMDGRTS